MKIAINNTRNHNKIRFLVSLVVALLIVNTSLIKPESAQAVSLQSNFLKSDSTAQAIASGSLSNYSITNFNYTYGQNGKGDTTNFAFRFISALRMLGYVQGINTIGGQNPGQVLLNRFDRLNGLPTSPIIDSAVLQRVDSALVARESADSSLASQFPLYTHFVDAPLNEPTKDHVAALWTTALQALPSSLVVWNEQNIKDYISHQVQGIYTDLSSSNYHICDQAIYTEYADTCQMTWTNQVGSFRDDFDWADTIIHEYAHYLDRNLYARNTATSQGLIDTTGFYGITYDLNNKQTSGWTFYTLLRPSNILNEFVGAYAQGWQLSEGSPYYTATEDFAESFAMYVTAGKAFRTLGQTNSILQQKYDWLKTNVFNGTDYQSGQDNWPQLLKQYASSQQQSATWAYNIRDFTQADPDFVWNYSFLNGSKATIIPTPSPSQLYPDGKLINDNGTIYVIEYGLKRPFASMSAFSGLGYSLNNVVQASIAGISVGTGIFNSNQRHPRGTLIVSNGTVYFLGQSLQYPFTSAGIFLSWGNNWKDIVKANSYDLTVQLGSTVQLKQ